MTFLENWVRRLQTWRNAAIARLMGQKKLAPNAPKADCPGSRSQDQSLKAQAGEACACLSPGNEQVEAALVESQARLQTLFEGVETGIFIIDPKTHKIVDANPLAMEMVGLPRERVVGSVCHKFVCPAPENQCPVTDLEQTVDNSERVLLTASGERRAIIKTVRPVTIERRPHLLESFLDITERKRADAIAKERTAYLNSLIDVSPFGIVVIDPDGYLNLSNPAFERLFQYPPAEIVGAKLDKLIVPPESIAEFNSIYAQCRNGSTVRAASRRRRKDGTLVDVQIFAVPIVIEGKDRGLMVLYEDITTQVKAEKAMAERHRLATLAARVGAALTAADDMRPGLQTCTDILANGIDIDLARIWTLNEGKKALELQASTGMDSYVDGEYARIPIGQLKIGCIVETGEPDFTNSEIEDLLPADWNCPERVTAFAGYPLKVNGHIVGVVAAFARSPLTGAALQTLASITDSIAQFIDRKRGEESLHESEDRFRSAFEEAPFGMCMTALNGRFLNANAAFCEMTGYSSEELIGGAWQQITHPEDIEASQQIIEEFRGGMLRTRDFETRYLHKCGNVIWAHVKISLINDSVGSPSHFITQIEDVTLRKQADEAKAFLASLVESSQDAIIGKTAAGIVVSWNHGAQMLYGYAAEEMIGKSVSILIPADRADEAQKATERACRGEQISAYETVHLHKGGSLIDVALTISPVLDAAGNVSVIAVIAHDITKRKLAEQTTRLQTAALESAASGVLISDRNGQIQWVNPAFTRLTGYSAEETLGKTPRILKSGKQPPAFYEELWATILRGEMWNGEIVNRQKDGSLYHEEMTITPVHSANGTLNHFVAIKQNITERKRAEEELRFKTALLETEAEATIDGILVVDPSGHLLQANQRFTELFKIPPEMMNGGADRPLLNYVCSQSKDRDAFVERVMYLYTHQTEKARDEVVLKDGTVLDRYSSPLRDSNGKHYGRIWYFRDITDRKLTEQALRASERQYRELFENATEIIFTTDLDGLFTSLNLAGQKPLGYSKEEAAKLNIWDLVTDRDRKILEHGRAQLFASESQVTSEIEVTAKGGRCVKLEIRPRLIFERETPVGIQAIARDITGRDMAEMELRQAQKLESVGRLASGIAHEINTPIQFVGDNTRFLQDAFVSIEKLIRTCHQFLDASTASHSDSSLVLEIRKAEEQADCDYLLEEIPKALSQMLEGIDRVATIVRAMKEFAHPENTEMAAADINKALKSTMTVARNELKYVAEIEAQFGDLPLVICNVGDLNQVFLNLLVNAAHAIGDVVKDSGARGKITVQTAAEGDRVLISIADTGSGIPAAIRNRIFDPFFTTKEVGRGTGQGLAIARSVVVERHGGTLTFESEEGKGTTFYIRLPISPEAVKQETSSL
jgi:two-component system NtrC family sensor kinase